MAEWPIAAVLKTAVGQPTVGSNPTSSESLPRIRGAFLSHLGLFKGVINAFNLIDRFCFPFRWVLGKEIAFL